MTATIVVVEDDKNINEVVTEYLKDANYTVFSFLNGRQALEFIEDTMDISLFIFDIMLPEVTGVELLKAVRANEIHKEAPVLMLTALSDEQTQLTSFEELADDFVNKPFSPKILLKRVEALLRRSGELVSQLKAGAITINTDSYEVYENQNKVILTLKEYELLRILMKNSPKVLTRQQLLNLVWGYDYFGDERIVDVHIKNLRKKFKQNIIITVKGIGYKIETSE